jgi:hypothetical protein
MLTKLKISNHMSDLVKCGAGPKGLFAVATNFNQLTYLNISKLSEDIGFNAIDTEVAHIIATHLA